MYTNSMDNSGWFTQFIKSKEYTFIQNHPIVYFCAEYALEDNAAAYAGGLGVLAGDIIREAAEQKIPLVAVGLFYHEGYKHHDLYKEGILMKNSHFLHQNNGSLLPVVDAKNNRVVVELPIGDVSVFVQAWIKRIGSVCMYLLDTNMLQNSEENRNITNQLYPSSKEVRFKQEMVLGLGGLRLLEALQMQPVGYHLNEGHSAFLALEIARYEMKKHKRTFALESENTKQHIFYTNHTLIAAGNDIFDIDLVSRFLSGFVKELGVSIQDIIALGKVGKSDMFSMTLLALKMAGKINAVSVLQAKIARSVWKEYTMTPITNGIHIQTWDNVLTKEDIWLKHQQNKRELLAYIHKETGILWEEDVLLLGWARRIVGYKRPLALFDNFEHFRELATSSDRPIRVVISGLVHQSDDEGLVILQKIQKIITDLKGVVVYLPGYNMQLAKKLIAGCDVWLNTPVVGSEACGTSGMKAALNGVLPCSTFDGWVDEAELYKVGWLLQSINLSDDILSVLQKKVVPLYYERDNNGIPKQWVTMMENARDMVINQFSATKMLRRYFEEFYLPVIQKHEEKLH